MIKIVGDSRQVLVTTNVGGDRQVLVTRILVMRDKCRR